MNQDVKRLPIASDQETPALPWRKRLRQILTPNTVMKRWTYAGLLLAVAGSANVLFAVVASPMLAISAAYYAWKSIGWLRERLMWKVRNRILASFVFVGILPTAIVALIGGIVGWFLIGAMGANLTLQQVGNAIDRLDRLPLEIQLELYRTSADSQLDIARAINATVAAHRDLPFPLSVMVFERAEEEHRLIAASALTPPDMDRLPVWIAEKPFAGLVAVDSATAYFRAGSDIVMENRRFYVLASMPLNQAYQTRVWTETGVWLSMDRFSSAPESAPSPRRVQPRPRRSAALGPDGENAQIPAWTRLPWGLGEFRLPWVGVFEMTNWTNGRKSDVFLEMSLDPVRIVSHTMEAESDFTQLLLAILIANCGALVVVELISVAIGLLISRRITSAVHTLSQGTQAIRAGNLGFRVPAQKRDQLGELARSFNAMAQSIQVLLTEVRDKQRIEAELTMARDVQRRLFPEAPPHTARLELTGTCVPARVVSGDYYDYILHKNQTLDIVVSDISGKGMSAALMMASLQSALHSQMLINGLETQPGRLSMMVERLNRYLCETTAPDKFATLFICSLDAHTSKMTYCCAGHNPPFLFKNGSAAVLSEGGCPIGMFSDWTYEENSVSIAPDDLIVIYTDGITEAKNRKDEEFGETRLKEVIADHQTLSCDAIQECILTAVRDFSRGVEQFDDQTVVVGRVRQG